ncbi:hypothetical protein YB2330_002726 [Saitoella coloradoensis]
MSFLTQISKRTFTTSLAQFSKAMNSETISKITAAEKEITGEDHAVKGGPTARAQQHANKPITSQVLHDVTEGEKRVSGEDHAIKGGPTSVAQSELSGSRQGGQGRQNENQTTSASGSAGSGKVDSATLSVINDAESKLTGQREPVAGGPTALAQGHANKPITSQVLHDITEGEKRVTGEDHAVKGGPTAKAQSVLSDARK